MTRIKKQKTPNARQSAAKAVKRELIPPPSTRQARRRTSKNSVCCGRPKHFNDETKYGGVTLRHVCKSAEERKEKEAAVLSQKSKNLSAIWIVFS
jgi:hypothetical protein